MPQITVYLRQDDLPKWKAIEKKSEFLHEALNGTPGFSKEPVKGPVFKKRDPETFDKLKQKLDNRDAPITYKKGNWGA